MELEDLELFFQDLRERGFDTIQLIPYLDLFLGGELPEYYATMTKRFDDDEVRYRLDFRTLKDGRPEFIGYRATLAKHGLEQEVSHYFLIKDNEAAVGASAAYNLFNGRSLMIFNPVDPLGSENYWLKLQPVDVAIAGKQFEEIRLPVFEIEEELKKLPVEELKNDVSTVRVLMGLMNGQLVPVNVTIGEAKTMAAYIAADPLNQTLHLFDNRKQHKTLAALVQEGRSGELMDQHEKNYVIQKVDTGLVTTDLLEIGRYSQKLDFTALPVYEMMKERTKGNDHSYGMSFTSIKIFGDDTLSCSIRVDFDEVRSLYSLKGVHAVKLSLPPIVHIRRPGVDTRSLDESLGAINWNLTADQLFKSSSISDTYFDLINLAKHQDPEVKEVANQLMFRHWKHTLVEDALEMKLDTSRYERSMFFPLNSDMNDLNATKIYNLLSERAVMQVSPGETGFDASYWIRIRNGEIERIPGFDFSEALNSQQILKPGLEYDKKEFLHAVIEGSVPKADFIHEGKQVNGFIHIDPENKRFILYDGDKNRLTERIREEQRPQVRQKFGFFQRDKPGRPKRNKGKGL